MKVTDKIKDLQLQLRGLSSQYKTIQTGTDKSTKFTTSYKIKSKGEKPKKRSQKDPELSKDPELIKPETKKSSSKKEGDQK